MKSVNLSNTERNLFSLVHSGGSMDRSLNGSNPMAGRGLQGKEMADSMGGSQGAVGSDSAGSPTIKKKRPVLVRRMS